MKKAAMTAMTKVSKWFFLSVVLLSLPSFAASVSTEHTLSNGLKVVVKEDHRSPVVVSMVWYRAGSMDEFNGTTGVAHDLEHMMFKGTKKVPGGEFSKRIALAGGRDNAFTNRDYTAYFQQLQKSKLPLALELEADRMQNLILSKEEFTKEIQVVMEERRWRTDDQPHSLVYEKFNATAFQSTSYRVPVIGWMNDLQNMKVEDARAWYQRWYAPNNATLVVIGDVKPAEVFALAQRYFGKIKAKPLPVRKPQVEPPQLGIKRISVKAPATLPYMLMGYHVPVLRDVEKDWEPYALEILASVLDGNESARLPRVLVREGQLASSVGASYDSTSRGPGIFFLDGTPSEGKSVADLELGIREQLQKLIQSGITEEELNRAKAAVVSSQVFQLDSMFYQAMQIGELEVVGLSHKDVDRIIAKLKMVTAMQVQEVAKKYLVDDQLTVAVLDPQPLDTTKPAQPPKGLRHAQ